MIGLVLLIVAGWALLDRYTSFNAQLAVPLLLGVIFTGWSLVTREWGLLVPGGILTGIGAGVLFARSTDLSRVVDSGWFLLCFAGGWVLITVLSATHFKRRVLWPLIPAGVLGVIGASHLAVPEVQRGVRVIQDFWPWALLIVAAWLLFVKGRR